MVKISYDNSSVFSFAHAVFFQFCAGLFLYLILMPQSAFSQVQTARVELTDNAHYIQLGESMYVTMDADKKLNAQQLISQHWQNIRGQKQDNSILNLGANSQPVWILFTVLNQSNDENWVLDFGDVLHGRWGFIKKLEIARKSKNKEDFEVLYSYDRPPEQNKTALSGNALALKIDKGISQDFVIYIESAGGLAGTIAPQLVRQSAFLEHSILSNILSHSYIFLFITAIGFFAAIAYTQENYIYGLFSGFYLLNLILVSLVDQFFVASFFLYDDLILFGFSLSFLIFIAITKGFLRIDAESYTENSILSVTALIMLVAAGANLILFDETTPFNLLLFYFPALASLGILGMLSYLQARKGRYSALDLCFAWLVTFLGLLITCLSAFGILGSSFFTLNAYWIALIPQGAFFVKASHARLQMIEQKRRNEMVKENRAAQTMARLQKSKESADQARLLRVIERERELMAELREREIQRTEEMRRAKDMADVASRAKSAFLAVVSHEIRTPMTGIMGIVRLLKDTQLNKDQNDYIQAIQKSGDTMMALLNDILDFEKIEAGNMELESISFDLPKLVQGIITLMSGHAASKKVSLLSDMPDNVPRFVVGDPTRLRQVLLNLINNALKFTDQGAVTLHVRAKPVETSKAGKNNARHYDLYFAVEDTGIGITKEAQDKLFNPFEQAESSIARKYGGTGLGLAICKRIIAAMGSAIRVTSEPGVGSTFYFNLILQEGAHDDQDVQDQISAEKKPDNAKALKILVIEDNEINRKVLFNFLEKDGHRVILADSAEMALDICRKEDFDAILTDIQLPGMNGLEMCRILRASKEFKLTELPIIAITGNTAKADIEEIFKSGINAYISKPIDYDGLRDLLVDVYHGRIAKAQLADDYYTRFLLKDEDEDDIEPEQQQSPAAGTDMTEEPLTVFEDEESPAPRAEDEVSPIQQFANTMQTEAPAEDDIPVFDEDVIRGLLDSLGQDQVKDLLNSYLDKADEIIAELTQSKSADNLGFIMDKAHELKGMAANFGMTRLSHYAGQAEDTAKDGKAEEALSLADTLIQENENSKHVLKAWMDSLQMVDAGSS